MLTGQAVTFEDLSEDMQDYILHGGFTPFAEVGGRSPNEQSEKQVECHLAVKCARNDPPEVSQAVSSDLNLSRLRKNA